MEPKKNYIDEHGNYMNVQNLTLTQIYDSGVEEGFRIAKQEINDKTLEIAQKSAKLGRRLGKLEGKTERTKGHWIYHRGTVNSYFKCSNCGRFPAKEVFVDENDPLFTDMTREDAYRFCFHCGTDMRGKNE